MMDLADLPPSKLCFEPDMNQLCSYRPRKGFVPCSAPMGTEFADRHVWTNTLCADCAVIRDLILSSTGDGEDWQPFDSFPTPVKEPMCQYSQFRRYIGMATSLKRRTLAGCEQSAVEGCHLCSLIVQVLDIQNAGISERSVYVCAYLELEEPLSFEVVIGSLENYHSDHRYLSIFTDDQRSDIMESESMAITTASAQIFDWAKTRLTDCLATHTGCQVNKSKKSISLPTRLIQVFRDPSTGKLGTKIVKSLALLDADMPYATLSYCWGDSPTPMMLTKSTEVDFHERLPLEELPKTCRDAIELCDLLGIGYIWIDALCIIQDCLEDRLHEITHMHHVYRNSTVCIAALDAADKSQGCFGYRNPLMQRQCVLGERDDNRTMTVAHNFYRDEVLISPLYSAQLCSRGWVVQERLLSPRSIYFGEDVIWECCEHYEREMGGPSWTPGHKLGVAVFDHASCTTSCQETPYINPAGHPCTISTVLLETLKIWQEALDTYNHSTLRHLGDTLAAVAGISQYLEVASGLSCFAGVWTDDDLILPHQLLWHWNRNVDADYRIAPTWSIFSIGSRWPEAAQVTPPSLCKFFFKRFLCSAASLHSKRTFLSERCLSQFAELRILAVLLPLELSRENSAQHHQARPEASDNQYISLPDIDKHVKRESGTTSVHLDGCTAMDVFCKPDAANSQLYFMPVLLTRQHEHNPYIVCHGLIIVRAECAILFGIKDITAQSQREPTNMHFEAQTDHLSFCRLGKMTFEVSNTDLPVFHCLVSQELQQDLCLL